MVVEFSKQFFKELKKHCSQSRAKQTIKKLAATSPADGDFVALVANIVIREKRLNSFRFYVIVNDGLKHVVSKEELKLFLIKFVALSKKNNQQDVIDKLKEQIQSAGVKL